MCRVVLEVFAKYHKFEGSKLLKKYSRRTSSQLQKHGLKIGHFSRMGRETLLEITILEVR